MPDKSLLARVVKQVKTNRQQQYDELQQSTHNHLLTPYKLLLLASYPSKDQKAFRVRYKCTALDQPLLLLQFLLKIRISIHLQIILLDRPLLLFRYKRFEEFHVD